MEHAPPLNTTSSTVSQLLPPLHTGSCGEGGSWYISRASRKAQVTKLTNPKIQFGFVHFGCVHFVTWDFQEAREIHNPIIFCLDWNKLYTFVLCSVGELYSCV